MRLTRNFYMSFNIIPAESFVIHDEKDLSLKIDPLI